MDTENNFPVLPPYVAPTDTASRGSASSLNKVAPDQLEKSLNIAGFGEAIPVLYGEDRIGGKCIAGPVVVGNTLYVALAWTQTNGNEIGGVQQVIINGSTTYTGVTVTHYKGNQTLPDPTLAGVITGFADVFKNTAYSVFKIRSTFGAEPRIEAIVRGIRVTDPRDSVVKWTENPALQMHDFVTNSLYGAGMSARGFQECADFCDSLDNGVTRCKSAIYIDKTHRLDELLDSFAAYAELLWSYEGAGIFVVTDTVIATETIKTISASDIERNSLRIGGINSLNSPTEIKVNFITPSAIFTEPWPQDTASALSSGAMIGDVDTVTSTIDMPGIRRQAEAQRKAILRLNRLQSPAQIAFQIHDSGISLQKGDGVNLPDLLGLGADTVVRVMSNEMVSAGIYQITSELYTDALYDTDYTPPSTGGTIPVGGIVPYFGDGVPEGFAEWTAANGRLIKGAQIAGVENPVQTNVTGLTTWGGEHIGTIGEFADTSPSQFGTFYSGKLAAGGHNHSYTLKADFTTLPMHESLKFIRCTAPSQLPIAAGFFDLYSSAFAAVFAKRTSGSGLFMASGGAGVITGSGYSRKAIISNGLTITPTAVPHVHGRTNALLNPVGFLSALESSGGIAHTHSAPASLHAAIGNYVAASIYTALLSSYAPMRAVIGYDGTVASIPYGWLLCDGQNGTADMRDKFITQSVTAGAVSNDGVTVSATLGMGGAHNHRSGTVQGGAGVMGSHESLDGGHDHSITATITTPIVPAYNLLFIEYRG